MKLLLRAAAATAQTQTQAEREKIRQGKERGNKSRGKNLHTRNHILSLAPTNLFIFF